MVIVSDSSCIFKNYDPSWFERLCTRVITQGLMPLHLAIIMDGNRRYAKKKNLPRVWDGHKKGEETCLKVVNMCFDLGIPHLTVFSFSSDNFKRSAAEVNAIMNLTLHRMQMIFDGMNEMKEWDINWDVVGNCNTVPSVAIKNLFAKTGYLTRGHQRLTVHLAFSYSARQEICHGINNLVNGLLSDQLQVSDLTEHLLQESWAIQKDVPQVDILLRTSGDHRFSDFQLWQAGTAYLEFIDTSWPEFSFSDLLWAIFRYQRQVMFTGLPQNGKQKKKQLSNNDSNDAVENEKYRVSQFLSALRNQKWQVMIDKI